MSTSHRRRMPPRSVLVRAAAGAAVLAGTLTGCGVTDIPSAPRTVTVLVDPPATSSPSQVPTQTPARTVDTPPSPSGVPTTLAAGARRGAPASFEEAAARVGAAPVGGARDTFQSPSGNIVCNVGADLPVAACEVRDGRVTPPLPSICPPDGPQDIGRIELDDKGAFPVCNSDTIRTGSEPTLAYGSRTADVASGLACLSEEAGVTCVHRASRHGFFLARRTFVTF